jgi:hypothetical protein
MPSSQFCIYMHHPDLNLIKVMDSANIKQLALPHLLQRALGHLPVVDFVGSIPCYELGYVAGGDGGPGQLPEEGRLMS